MENNPSKLSVLVVDDNPAGLYTTSRILKQEGFQIIEAITGNAALRMVKEYFPDVVLLDVKLPDINGFEVCKIIKADKLTSNIPVIHLSATYLDPESKVLGLEGGADSYLTHPVEPKVLVATINAVLRIRQAEVKIHQAAIKWQTTFDSINDGVCLIDTSGNITQCNKAFMRLIGEQQNSLAGKKLCSLCKEFENYNADFFEKVYNDLLTGEKDEILINNKWFLTSVDSIQNENGLYTGTVFKMTNITSKKKAEDLLQKAMQELERSNKELEQFAFIASHDLQEPLRMISSYMQLLEQRYKNKIDENADKYINFAIDGARRMQQLISDLLTYSRASRRTNTLTQVDMQSVLDKVKSNLEMNIYSSNAVISNEPLPVIFGNETQLTQLFQNLINNAIKFHREAPPHIIITAEEMMDDWLFIISDNGIGIDQQFFDKIFVIFQRLHMQADFPGTGIGLAICKKIVEIHKGRIWVESEPNKGSRFFFTISKKL